MKNYIHPYYVHVHRMWINQPSTLQPYHHLNGINVLGAQMTPDTHRVFFLTNDTNGQDIESMEIPTKALSDGWQTQSNINPGIIKRKGL